MATRLNGSTNDIRFGCHLLRISIFVT